MSNRFYLILCLLQVFNAPIVFGACAAGKPMRRISSFSPPASMTTLMLSNPSSVSQYISVNINVKGSEQIHNAFVSNLFGVYTCVGSCSWGMPNGAALTCTGYTKCTATFSLGAGAVKRMGYGSKLGTGACSGGCPPLQLNSPDSGTMIEINTCDESSTSVGYLEGFIDSFYDTADTGSSRPINGGRPF